MALATANDPSLQPGIKTASSSALRLSDGRFDIVRWFHLETLAYQFQNTPYRGLPPPLGLTPPLAKRRPARQRRDTNDDFLLWPWPERIVG